MNSKHKIGLGIVILCFFWVNVAEAVPPEGRYGWFAPISQIIGDDLTCGPNSIRIDLELLEYGTNNPATVANATFRIVNPLTGVVTDEASGLGPIIGPVCMNPDTNVMRATIQGGVYYDFFVGTRLTNPENVPRGKHMRKTIWLVNSASGRGVDYHPVSPINNITINNNPPYIFSLNYLPTAYGATQMQSAQQTVFRWNSVSGWGVAHSREVNLSGGVGQKTLPPIAGLSDGIYTWTAYLSMNGINTMSAPGVSFLVPNVLTSGLMSREGNFTLDTTAPDIGIASGHVPVNPTDTDTVTLTGTVTDSLSGVTEIRVFVNGVASETCGFTARLNAGCGLVVGPYPANTTVQYFFTARDAAGNTATSSTRSFTVAASVPPPPPRSVGVPITCGTPDSVVLSQATANSGFGNGTPQSFSLEGDYLYVGASGGHENHHGLYIYDISNPASISQVSFFSTHNPPSVRNNSSWGNQVLGVDVEGGYAYLATFVGGLVIVDVSNPGAPTFVGRVPLFNINPPGARDTWSVRVRGSYAYLAAGRGMIVVDVSNPAAPTVVANLNLGADISQNIILDGEYAFVAMRWNGIAIVDISDPRNPAIIRLFNDAFNGSNWAYSLALNGDYLYVANHFAGTIRIYDVLNKSNPVFLSIVTVPGSHSLRTWPRTLHIEDGVLYVSSDNAGAHIYDISNPISPVLVHRIDDPVLASTAAIWGATPLPGEDFTRIALISRDTAAGVYIVDTTCDPPAPLPDLEAASTTLSSPTVMVGDTITFSTGAITNIGTATAGPYTIAGFFIDANGDGVSDYSAPASAVSASTSPTGSNNSSASWTVPAGATPGVYRVGYIANDPSSFSELNFANNWSGWTTFTVLAAPAQPDLVPLSIDHQSGFLVEGDTVTFRSQAYNASMAGTAVGFATIFSYRWNTTSPWVDLTPPATKPALGGADDATPDISPNLFLSSTGNLYVQYCVDSGDDISEGVAGELNNCAERTFIITSTPSATLSNLGCTIAAGNSTCNQDISWVFNNATAPYQVDNITPPPTNIYTGNDASGMAPSVLRHGNNVISARDANRVLAHQVLSAICANGTGWSNVSSTCVPLPPAPTITMTVNNEMIRTGDTAEIRMEVNSSEPTTCTVLGAQGSPIVISHSGTPATETYTITTRPLTAAQRISVTCSVNAFPLITSNREGRVNVVGLWQEL